MPGTAYRAARRSARPGVTRAPTTKSIPNLKAIELRRIAIVAIHDAKPPYIMKDKQNGKKRFDAIKQRYHKN
jgi:hypothetical protein